MLRDVIDVVNGVALLGVDVAMAAARGQGKGGTRREWGEGAVAALRLITCDRPSTVRSHANGSPGSPLRGAWDGRGGSLAQGFKLAALTPLHPTRYRLTAWHARGQRFVPECLPTHPMNHKYDKEEQPTKLSNTRGAEPRCALNSKYQNQHVHDSDSPYPNLQ